MDGRTFILAYVAFFVLVSGSYGLPSDKCATCRANLGNIKENVLRQIRQQPVDALIGAMCNSAPDVFDEDCYNLGLEHVTTILSNLEALDTDVLCEMLGQCHVIGDHSNTDRDTALTGTFEIEQSPFFPGILCHMCKTTMTMVQSYLHDPKHQDAIIRIMKNVCHFLPFIRKECSVLVERYGHLAISLASHFVTPQLCVTFHVCKKAPMGKMDDLCRPCELGVGIIKDFVMNPNSEGEVRAMAIEFFSQISDSTDKMCESSVDKYLPEVFRYLRSVQLEAMCSKFMDCEDGDFEIAGHM